MRLVLVDDSWLNREGLARLLSAHGHVVVGAAGDPAEAAQLVRDRLPELVILDIKMPPTFTDEGLRLASALRRRHPELPLLLLSQYLEPAYATTFLELTGSRRCGYLLKERVLDATELESTLTRLTAGEVVVDPEVVRLLLESAQARDPLSVLTARERDVLALLAQGLTDRAIADRLFVSLNTVGTHVRHLMTKLDIPAGPDDNRRVLTVLAFLANTSTHR